MTNQKNSSHYDYVFFGESFASLISAELLTQFGARVLIIRNENTLHPQSFIFGFEKNGVFNNLFRKIDTIKNLIASTPFVKPQYEISTHEMRVSLREDLTSIGFGSPAFEVGDYFSSQIWHTLTEMEKDPKWKEKIFEVFSHLLIRSQKGWRKFIPRKNLVEKFWQKSLHQSLIPFLKDTTLIKQYKKKYYSQRRSDFLKSVAYLMGAHRYRLKVGRYPLVQSLVEMTSLRSSQMMNMPKHTVDNPQISQRDEMPIKVAYKNHQWEVEFIDSKVTAQYFVLADLPTDRFMQLFDNYTAKKINDLFRSRNDYWMVSQFKVRKEDLQILNNTEVLHLGEYDIPVRISVFSEDEKYIVIHAQCQIDSKDVIRDSLSQVQDRYLIRLKKEICKVFPHLTNESLLEGACFIEDVKSFKEKPGVYTRTVPLYHAHSMTYPSYGEFGPYLAALEIARIYAQKNKKEFSL